MNPKLTEQLQQTLAALLANAQDAAAWTKGQIPSLVQEKILFGRVNETVQLVLCGVALYFAVKCCRICLAKAQECGYGDDPVGWVLGTAAMGAASGVLIVAGFSQVQTVLMVWFAPRLYIVEWLMAQVHK